MTHTSVSRSGQRGIFYALFPLALVACDSSASTTTGNTTGTTKAAPQTSVAKTTTPSSAAAKQTVPGEGQECHGAGGTLCPANLQCVMPQNKGCLQVSDLGHFQRRGTEGTPCRKSLVTCEKPLVCADLRGNQPPRCRKPGAEGTSCAGDDGSNCAAGFVCVMDKGSGGTCRRPGERCNTKRCPSDQVCCDWSKSECTPKDKTQSCKPG